MKKTILFSCLVFTIFLTILCSGCSLPAPVNNPDASLPVTEPPPPSSPSPLSPSPEKTLVISAVGDIMMHNTQIKAGYQPNSATYDFSSFFHHIKPLLRESDFVIGNLETTLGNDPSQYSGYPRFNTPAILAKNLKEAGFDLITTANNHCLDKGIKGLNDTLQYLEEAGLLHTGTARSQEEKETTLITEIQGIKTAFLAYTYGTNGLNPPSDKTFSVNYLVEEQICNDIKKARSEGAELVIVCPHFGQEYQKHPDSIQTHLSEKLLESGADLILGNHPHVLQPAIVYQSENKFVSYSLGNFISAQKGLARKTSIILNLYLGIDSTTGKPYFKKASYTPIWTRQFKKDGQLHFEVLPIEQVLAQINTGKTTEYTLAEKQEMEQAWEHVKSCFSY
jgi:hypothetical protein